MTAHRCGKCLRRYTAKLFNVDEFIRSNMAGIKSRAAKIDEPLEAEIEHRRTEFAAYLAARGFDNCARAGCKMAIKPMPEPET